MAESVSQMAACVFCNNDDCSTVVILSAVPDYRKRFDHQNHDLEVDCPACHRPFSISVREIVFQDVTDGDVAAGYILV